MKRSKLVPLIASWLILLFGYTVFSKLADIEEFRRQLANQVLPGWAIAPLIWLIPGSELAVSMLLLFSQTRLTGLYGAAILMMLFTGYTGLVLLEVFDRVPCSCGGVLRSMGFTEHFVFNLFFLAIAVTGIVIVHLLKQKNAVTQNE